MVVTGGIWAAIQTDLRRIFGYAVIIETGFMLLSISLRNEMGIQLFYYCIFTRALELAVLTLSITLLHGDDPGLRLNYPKAMTWKNSPSVFVLLAGLFSCVGMPMFASFPVRALLFTQFSGQPGIVLWVLLGSIAFMLIPFKVLRIIFRNHEQEWQMTDTIAKMTLGIVGILALLLVGILPSLFLEAIWNKLSIFLTM